MLVIGLTGGIGTGKSTVSETLKQLGAVVLDADKVGHEAYLPHSETWKRLVDAFGQGILQSSGEIDRKKLGALVFSDPKHLATLNSIVHPRIVEMMLEKLEGLRKQSIQVAVVEAAILVEAGWTRIVDEVWVTVAPETVVVKRILGRNPNLTEAQVRERIRSQITSEERNKHAHVVIDTDCTFDEVREKVKVLWRERVGERGLVRHGG